jgi:hypothetical protein
VQGEKEEHAPADLRRRLALHQQLVSASVVDPYCRNLPLLIQPMLRNHPRNPRSHERVKVEELVGHVRVLEEALLEDLGDVVDSG